LPKQEGWRGRRDGGGQASQSARAADAHDARAPTASSIAQNALCSWACEYARERRQTTKRETKRCCGLVAD
jgi:hypothetical protein